MDLQKLMIKRSQVRRVFKRHASTICDDGGTKADVKFLEEKILEMTELDEKIQDIMLLEDVKCDEIEKDYDESQEYQLQWIKIKDKWNNTATKKEKEDRVDSKVFEKISLPRIDLRKFDDNPKTWISFWTQYKKIHEDMAIAEEDKFGYLLHCMADGSKAKTLVESYPPTKDNYKKVLSTLKNRFAKDEVLIEIYVREMLMLAVSKNKIEIELLYDKISVNVQILDSLGIGKNKYECILLPLIESALPDSVLVQWAKLALQRGVTSKLEHLLEFLENEVEAQRRCSLAKSFNSQVSTPTAACFISKVAGNIIKEGKNICYFCEKGHHTLECNKAGNFTLEKKKIAIKQKGGCFICLKRGHLAKYCKSFVKCMCCSRKHSIVLCPTLHTITKSCKQKTEEDENSKEVSNHLTKNNNTTLLQTLVVNVSTDTRQKKVRVLLDSGSQRTYIKRKLAEDLKLEVTGNECLGHSLFGGVKKPLRMHRIFKFNVSSLDKKYNTTMTALEQDELCSSLPKVHDSELIQYLKKLRITLTDTEQDINDIGMLIGSDQLGIIISEENFVPLNDDLVAIPTKLGWTLQGPIQGINSTGVTSHFISNLQLLGNNDAHEKQDRTEIQNNYNRCITVNNEERYEINLMCKGNSNLQSSYEQAHKRLMSTTKSKVSMTKNGEDISAAEMKKDVSVNIESNTDNFRRKLLYFSKYKKIVRLVARFLRMSPKTRRKYYININYLLS